MTHVWNTRHGFVREVKQFVADSDFREREKKLAAIPVAVGHLALYAAESKRRGRRHLKLIGLIHDREASSITLESRDLSLPAHDEIRKSPILYSYSRSISYHPELDTHGPTAMTHDDLQLTHNILHYITNGKKKHDPFKNERARAIAREVIVAGDNPEVYDAMPALIVNQFVGELPHLRQPTA